MKVWWLARDRNFGDLLTPYVLDFFKVPYEYTKDYSEANCLCIGSIAHKSSPGKIILGSGIIDSNTKVNGRADWKFVRGPKTRDRVLAAGGKCPPIYGDPALLLPKFCRESSKEYDVGIVPHFVDYEYVNNTYKNYKIIDVINDNPLEVAKEITKCRYIISSSLHGIIAAHAYNIPAAWVKFSDKLAGDGIKFVDHYESIGLTATLSTVEKPVYTTGKFNLSSIEDIFQELLV